MREHFGQRGWSRLAAGLAALALASGVSLATPAEVTSTATSATKKTSEAAPAKLDINSASKAELSGLPGIGDVYSQKIIDGRPYKSKAELESKKILPKGIYEKIAPLIIAHQK